MTEKTPVILDAMNTKAKTLSTSVYGKLKTLLTFVYGKTMELPAFVKNKLGCVCRGGGDSVSRGSSDYEMIAGV